MLSTRSNTTVSTEQQRDTRTVPESVAVGDWIRETTIGNRTTKEHLYTVNATVYRVKNSSKFIDIVKKSLESSDCKPGDQVALYSRKRGRLLAKAEIAVLETGAKVQEIDSRDKTATARRSLEKGGAKIALVETQSDLDRLLKLVERRKPEALEKIIVLGKGITVPDAHKDLVLFAAKDGKTSSSPRVEIEARRASPERSGRRERASEGATREPRRAAQESRYEPDRSKASIKIEKFASELELLRVPSLESILPGGRRERAAERADSRSTSARAPRDEITVEELRAAGIPSVRLDKRELPELVLSSRPGTEAADEKQDHEREAAPRRRIKTRAELRRGTKQAERREANLEEPASAAYERRAMPDLAAISAGAVLPASLPTEWASVSLPKIDRAALKASIANMDDRREGARTASRTVEDRFIARPVEQIVESLREIVQEAKAEASSSLQRTESAEPAALAMRMPDNEPEASAEQTIPSGKILRLARAA